MNNLNYRNLFIFSSIFIAIIIFMALYLLYFNNKETKNTENLYNNNENNYNKISWETKYIKAEKNTQTVTPLIVENKKWSQKEIYKRFDTVKSNNNTYISNGIIIEKQNLGNFIEKEKIIAYDDENVEQIIFSDIYELNGISSQCAIAVNFENDMNYYLYINLNYTPNILKELVEDLNLNEVISISSISYNYSYFDEGGKEQYENIKFENINKSDIFNILFYDLDLENLNEESNLHQDYIMTINCKILLLNSDININITNDGYLLTNILGTEKIFYLGKEKIEEFVNYIVKNYTGYKIVYIDDNEEETVYPDDKILTIQNTLND